MRDAKELIAAALAALDDRATERDTPEGERAMPLTVALFSTWTGISMTEEHGNRFMVCLKMAREIQGEPKADDYTDLAGYAGLLGESVLRGQSCRK